MDAPSFPSSAASATGLPDEAATTNTPSGEPDNSSALLETMPISPPYIGSLGDNANGQGTDELFESLNSSTNDLPEGSLADGFPFSPENSLNSPGHHHENDNYQSHGKIVNGNGNDALERDMGTNGDVQHNGEADAGAGDPLDNRQAVTQDDLDEAWHSNGKGAPEPSQQEDEVISLTQSDATVDAMNAEQPEPLHENGAGDVSQNGAPEAKKARTDSWSRSNGATAIQPGRSLGPDIAATIENLYRPAQGMMPHPAAQQNQRFAPLQDPRGPASGGFPTQTSAPIRGSAAASAGAPTPRPSTHYDYPPVYFDFAESFQPTWKIILPIVARPNPPAMGARSNQKRAFRLSLLNVSEFTITGLPTTMDGYPTPVTNLRKIIKQISREHGKAVYEKGKDGVGGKWRIPLGAYQNFYGFLAEDRNTRLDGVPDHQLNIATLERARQEKGYPSCEEIIRMGVPPGLAKALAPFQRGGVDFVVAKKGRALIADDMGLGKTIQGIASMSVYSNEWPLLVLCPSSARYHWASECRKWLGRDSPINASTTGDNNSDNDGSDSKPHVDSSKLLLPSQVHVLTASKDPVFPTSDTKVVVCSYGLVPTMVANGDITPGLFKCAIVDESHMLKNKSAKRTLGLIPILRDGATTRCVLLSGTPALSRPGELWPQLEIIGTRQHGWWEDEREFTERYVKNDAAEQRAELHALLTGTVMIRRLKPDILKTLPHKLRQKATVKLLTDEHRSEFKQLLLELRDSKGALGKLARQEHAESADGSDTGGAGLGGGVAVASATLRDEAAARAELNKINRETAERACNEDVTMFFKLERAQITLRLQNAHHMSPYDLQNMRLALEGQLHANVESMHREGLASIAEKYGSVSDPVPTQDAENGGNKRKSLLSRLYGLTGDVKAPLIVDMLDKWFNDRTKGKVCIFAHHLSVLDAINAGAGLSNDTSSTRKYIRIDGSTSPKFRQEQIDAFQNDPSIRVALLGITAAGVAVTLTASATVWFAELFWTPALMIQAEDRAHRIGQAAQVKCLYVVAKGTLDDLLWKLMEKKFQDLGEFVEGKEKLKLVVHKHYTNTKDLFSMFETDAATYEHEDDGQNDEIMDGVWFSDEELEHDILSLGEEETKMLKETEGEDDDAVGGEAEDDQKPAAIEILSPDKKEDGLGKSEEAAITLSSEDESDGENCAPAPAAAKAPPVAVGTTAVVDSSGTVSAQAAATPRLGKAEDPLKDCRFYRMQFEGPSIGVDIEDFYGRLVVKRVTRGRSRRLGPDSKPSVGDIVVAINSTSCPHRLPVAHFQQQIEHAFKKAPVQLVFAEVPDVQMHVRAAYQKKKLPPVAPISEVIEIDSDDD